MEDIMRTLISVVCIVAFLVWVALYADARAPISPQLAPAAAAAKEPTKKEQLWQIFDEETRKLFWLETFASLKTASGRGELVEIADDPAVTCIKLRKIGKWPIAEKEKDVKRKPMYWQLRKPAAGLLYQIAAYMCDADAVEEVARIPLDITSLVRSWEYQKRLMKTNSTANVGKQGVPPTHVLGLAFDIAWGKMTAERFSRLQQYLEILQEQKKIIYFREQKTQAAFHVIALPAAHEEFQAYYDTVTASLATSAHPSPAAKVTHGR